MGKMFSVGKSYCEMVTALKAATFVARTREEGLYMQ